uniref:Uncharacterized protein n=1 Tax=Sphaerodactylus townsendi TaxID=933632 RepID=A0ACB8ETW7_9SAUR
MVALLPASRVRRVQGGGGGDRQSCVLGAADVLELDHALPRDLRGRLRPPWSKSPWTVRSKKAAMEGKQQPPSEVPFSTINHNQPVVSRGICPGGEKGPAAQEVPDWAPQFADGGSQEIARGSHLLGEAKLALF